ncbi:lysosomal-trafficking regulator isoform X2 [Pyxicephalus adspersus]|uniref:lysosomal-trafficking regulator isoform X2 n=1 Tax=Pyxicephalus adspersus TaxID=30357 RepID=UPI003B5C7A60
MKMTVPSTSYALGQSRKPGRRGTVRDLTCREELITLILSLLPLVWRIPLQEVKENILPSLEMEPLATTESCSTPQKPQRKVDTEGNFPSSDFSNLSNVGSRHHKSRRQCKNSYASKDENKSLSTSDSEGVLDKSSFATKLKCSQPTITSHSWDSDKGFTQPKVECKPKPVTSSLESDLLERPVCVLDKKASQFDLCQILLSLLEKVSKFDIKLNHSTSLSVTVIPALTEFLLGFGDFYAFMKGTLAKGWTEEPVALVQRMVLRTVLILLCADIISRNVMPDNLRKNLNDLLKTALKYKFYLNNKPDIYNQQSTKDVSENLETPRCQHQTLLIAELLEGIFHIMLLCLKCAAPNPLYFSQSLELLHDFVQYSGFDLLEKAILYMESICLQCENLCSGACENVSLLISNVIKIISVIKKVKSEQLHQSMCTRKRHRRCEFSHFVHHHRDLSGLPVSIFKSHVPKDPFEENIYEEVRYPERSCCIAVCAHQCLRLLQQASHNPTILQIISGIQNVGICCCMDPASVVLPLLYAFKIPKLIHLQQHALSLLANLLLDQLGGGESSNTVKQASCNICAMDGENLAELQDTIQGKSDTALSTNLCSMSYTFQGVLPRSGSEDMMWKWDSLKAYQELVFSNDLHLSLPIATHICSIIQKGNAVIQWKLYTLIFNAVLQRGVEIAHRYQQMGSSASYSHTSSYNKTGLSEESLKVYLKVLPELLKSSVIREVFLNSNGLNQITELNYLDSLRYFCLKAFETLICYGKQQMDSLSPNLDNGSLDSNPLPLEFHVQFSKPQQWLHNIQTKDFTDLKELCSKRKRVIHQKTNIINLFLCLAFLSVSKDSESDFETVNESEDTSGYDSTASEPRSILPKFNVESLALPPTEQIHRAADIWSVCCWLYISNALFQKQFHKIGGFDLCYKLIFLIINTFSSNFEVLRSKILPVPREKFIWAVEVGVGMEGHCPTDCTNLDASKELSFRYLPPDHQYSLFDKSFFVSTPTTEVKEWPVDTVKLFEALLAICLQSSQNNQLKTDLGASQNLTVQHILAETQDLLSKSRVLQTNLAPHILDCLLRIAVSDFSFMSVCLEEQKQKIHKSNILNIQHKEVSDEGDEVYSVNFSFLEEEGGYEADSESNPKDASEDDGMKIEIQDTETNDQVDLNRDGELLYPEICSLVLNLLSEDHTNLSLLTSVFQSLLKILKTKRKNAMLLVQQGTTKSLLIGFKFILGSNDPEIKDCQEVLVELLVSLMSFRITSEELTLFLRCFLENTLQTEMLLKGFLKITEANRNIVPLKYLTFPLQQCIGGVAGTVQNAPGCTTGKMSGFFKRAKVWHSKDMHGDALLSSWHIAPIYLPLVGQNCWPHMSDGFSFTIWLKSEYSLDVEYLNKGKHVKKKNNMVYIQTQNAEADKAVGPDGSCNDRLIDDGCIHLLSVGSKVLMMQIWVRLTTGRLIFRLCTHINDELKCVFLSQSETQENVLHPGHWQHLAFTYKELSENRNKVHSKILMWVSGRRKSEVAVEYVPPRKGSLSSDSNRTFCMVGHQTSSQEDIIGMAGQMSLGNLLLFNGPSLGAEEAFDLYCQGPDFTSLMTCKYGNSSMDNCKYISKEILQNEQICDFLIKSKGSDMSLLADSLAIVYDMQSPTRYTIYEPVIRNKGSMKLASSQRPFSTKEVCSKVLDSQALKMLQPYLEKNIHSVLHEIGGIGAMVYLFARTVEISSCEETQSMGLEIILSLTKYNRHRIQESKNCDLYSMIHQVLVRPKCIVGFHTLKILLYGCTGVWLLNINKNGQFNLNFDSTAVIKDIQLLEHLLLDWKIWSKAEAGVWETLLTSLQILIRDNHPFKVFNIKQFLRARVVHHFLIACQILQEHREEHITFIPQDVCVSYIRIIEEVLGSPPELDLLKLIFSFLLAVHPATNTYVCHNPNNFFFSLHIDDKTFQEKLKSFLHQRQSSLGGQSSLNHVFSSKCPSEFSDTLEKGTDVAMFSSQQHLHLSVAEMSRSKSLPPSPSCSPKVYPRALRGSLSKSIVDVQESVENDQSNEDKLCSSQHRLNVLRRQKEQYISSCESAQTVCDLMLPDCITITEPSKEYLGQLDNNLEVTADESGKVTPCESAGEVFLQRPHILKGISSSRKGQNNLTSFGPAFPSSGSLSSTSWTDMSEKKNSEEWGSFPLSPVFDLTRKDSVHLDGRSMNDCIHLVCCGLCDLLCGVVLTMPDIMIVDVFNEIIQPDVLIVLVNHPSPLIQQGVLKLLNSYFHRASKEYKEAFLKKSGFTLLANQLYLHQGSQRVVECLLEMFFGRCIGLDEEFGIEDIRNAGVFQKWCIIPILGMLENSLHNATLLHNSFCILLQIIHSCSKIADMLLDSGLLYALCNTLATLCAIETSISLDEYVLLTCDLQQLLIAVTIHACSCSGSQYFRIVEDLIILLGYFNESKNEMLQNMAVLMQFKILHSAIEFIKTTSCQDSQPVYSFVHSSHIKHLKRKSVAGSHRLTFAQSDPLLITMRSVASSELTELMHRRMSQENPIRASETEFVQRLHRLTVLSVNRLIYQEFSDSKTYPGLQMELSENEIQLDVLCVKKAFQSDLLKIMIEGIKLSLGSSRTSSPKNQWKTILLQCSDTFRVQLGRLFVHLMSPSQHIEERKEILLIVNDPKHEDMLKDCLCPGLQHGPKLALYVFELLHNHKESLTKEDEAAGVLLMNAIKQAGYRCIPPSAPLKSDLVKAAMEEQGKHENEEEANKAAWKKTILNNQQKLFQRLDTKLKDISKIAGEVTQNVSLSQGIERKNVIQHIRNMYKMDLSASRHWQELVQQLTHDRAVWYDPESYPTSYQLDPTEGPNRERRRLQRCYLTIPKKYILKDRQKKEEIVKPPLSYIFEEKTHSSLSSTVKEKAASELIRVNRRCINVAPSRETVGELLLGKSGMYFVEDSASDTVESNSLLGESEPASFSWTYEEIKEVHKRWWQLRDNAVEIFLTNGRTLLLAFDNTKVRDDVYQKILSNNLPNLLEYGNISALTQLWCSGQITNFEYLTHLNKHAGRSFNDLMQYPVFPFILSDYTSETLDLSNASIYRNLAKPIAVQNKEKEDRYIDNYKYLEDEYCKGHREDDPMPPVQPYHYGSHYSNSGTILHFMVRMPPFTKMFLAYQDQSFDIPDRTFHSMNTTWRLSSFESMTDVKELIPEFFYLPEFLVNREGFDFGVRQNGERVNHVNLPPWVRNDPRLFILIHRQALESDQVSQTICNWIDLVFGYKQKGRAAVQAINVFHPATYFGMDVSAVEDPVQRRALETMIKTYGQTPRQLFHGAHVSRPGLKPLMEGELPAAMGLLVQLAFRENRESSKEPSYPSPLPWIRGLKWGEYVGSPSSPDPIVCFSQPHGERFGSLQALPTRAICGLSKKFCLMMSYSKEQGVRSMHSTDIQWSAILSWGYPDNILRLKSKQSEPPVNFIQCSEHHQVTSCAWVPDSCQLYTGSNCGVITAYLNRFTNTTPMEIEVESQVHLYGHTGEITSLFVCKPYSIIISVSKDGTCIIWDLNRLCYVQSLTGHKSPVTAVSASETTGDIATVCDSVGGGSDLRLWTVNGDLIGHVHCREIICSIAFSNQPEGVSVNVIAGGLENGIVRLWSTWDLKPVREITFPKSNKPIISLTFSCDGHHLYTTNGEGTVIGWCRKDQQRLKLPMFYSFLSNYAAC